MFICALFGITFKKEDTQAYGEEEEE
jgi:hypothetical protein